ncbi:hypothetical protein HY624_03235 [Candidatus Uhrbacteria bacterium]|nr:hypothetical protein [Candidatus Uhrbacteria bacterium]
MSIVNFSIPRTLEGRIRTVVQEKGFASKAELFRFSVIHYLEEIERFPLDTNRHIATLSAVLEQELTKKIGEKPLPSIKKQLARLKTV